MVSDDTVHNITSKYHKKNEKAFILRCTFLHQYLSLKLKISLHTTPFQKRSGIIKNQIFMDKCAPQFCYFFGLVHKK